MINPISSLYAKYLVMRMDRYIGNSLERYLETLATACEVYTEREETDGAEQIKNAMKEVVLHIQRNEPYPFKGRYLYPEGLLCDYCRR